MGVNFTPGESSVLYRLLSENTSDIIILKTDRNGHIVHASTDLAKLGLLSRGERAEPHILDIVHPTSAAAVQAEHDAVMEGSQSREWVEFSATPQGGQERWFEIQMQPLRDGDGEVYGALSMMRSIEERRSFEERLFAVAMTDPLTGLTNRRAFLAMLQHLVDTEGGGCIALFDLDHFRAINMQHGHTVGDELLTIFSDLVRTLTRSQDLISRVGGESLGVLLPDATTLEASGICDSILKTLAEVSRAASNGSFQVTASAGLARIGPSLDDTMKRAELALFLAKAKGRNRLQMDDGPEAG